MRWQRIPLVLVSLSLTPAVAEAHLVTTGLGPFYDGAMHLALSPEDWLGLLAAALLAGLCGPKAGRWTLAVVPVSWLIGATLGMMIPGIPVLLVALDRNLPAWSIATLGCLFGLMHGLLNGVALYASPDRGLNLLGIGTTAFVLLLLVSAAAVSLRSGWTRVAVRVIGSWVVAVAILMLGWLFRGAV
jgi:urease accessory protein